MSIAEDSTVDGTGEDDGRIMAQSQSITARRLICTRDSGGGPAFLQGEQTTNKLGAARSHARLPTRASSGLILVIASQPSPSPESIVCAVGALVHAERHPATTAAQGHKASPCLCCAVLCAVLLTLLYVCTCMYCPHTVIMRSSLDTASKRAICHLPPQSRVNAQ